MTEQELKDKIVADIIPIIETADEFMIIETMSEKPSARKVAERIADALITAGLCDKNTLDERYQTLMAAGFVQLASLRLDLEKVLHRAEVAERALKIADELGELCGRKEDYVQQAEKELVEEGKNERRNVNV